MAITKMTFGGGDGWAAASARLRVQTPRPLMAGLGVCPQHGNAFSVFVKTVSVQKFDTDKNILGSPVSRPPV
jgi:hypothetical protein